VLHRRHRKGLPVAAFAGSGVIFTQRTDFTGENVQILDRPLEFVRARSYDSLVMRTWDESGELLMHIQAAAPFMSPG
jgi:hypothetical protein